MDRFEGFDLTIKNYRCFADDQPTRIRFDPGFTAFVGANNAGKSSLLRLFYELRPVWENLASTDLNSIIVHARQFQGRGTLDSEEIFFWGNERPLSLDFSWRVDDENEFCRILLEADRQSEWKASLWARDGEFVFSGFSNRDFVGQVGGRQRTMNGARLTKLFHILRSALYVGPFRNAVNVGDASYYDLRIGTGFIQHWDDWKTGPDKKKNQRIEDVTEDIRRIFALKKLEINASSDHKTMQVTVNGRAQKLYELGAGLAQFVVAFGAAATTRPAILLIDEPELHLHPRLQVDFLTSLTRYSSHGTWFCTHSMGLARASAEKIYSVVGRVSVQS